MITSPIFAGRKYAILGLARSGMATLDALVESGAHCLAWDSRDEAREAAASKAEIADPLAADLTGYHAIVVSPGVPLNSHPIATKAAEAGIPVIGDIELFAQARVSLPSHKVIGITGTNGKSTTTALVHHILKESGVPTRMGGNIGLPILSQEPLRDGGIYVLELSSYQIDLTFSLACEVAALLNLTPDHLDRYDGFAGYTASKARLFTMQGKRDQAVFGIADGPTKTIAADVFRRVDGPLVHNVDASALSGQSDWPALQGPHNLQNAAHAVAIVEAVGIEEAQWRPALASFGGLPHRMERMAEADGVLFVNDSKATNPASTAPALGAYKGIHWIVGGLPKGEGLEECLPYIGNVARAYTIGEAGPAFAQWLEPHVPVESCEMLGDAVRAAISHAKPGEVIMLSPACASFDQFRDFEARGECFRQIVAAMTGKDQPSAIATARGGAA